VALTFVFTGFAPLFISKKMLYGNAVSKKVFNASIVFSIVKYVQWLSSIFSRRR